MSDYKVKFLIDKTDSGYQHEGIFNPYNYGRGLEFNSFGIKGIIDDNWNSELSEKSLHILSLLYLVNGKHIKVNVMDSEHVFVVIEDAT